MGRPREAMVMDMLGTLVNVVAIVIGSLSGHFLIPAIPKSMSQTVTAGVALAVVLIGLDMALITQNLLIIILSLALGGAIGELAGIQGALDRIGERVRQAVPSAIGAGDAFVTATLIFCVGPMAIMGAIQSGVAGDHATLYAKSTLDGITSLVLGSTLGLGVLGSALPVLLYQGGITLAAAQLSTLLTADMVTELTASGGMIIVALGLNMLGVTGLRVANLLPALVLAPALSSLASIIFVLG